MIEPLPPPEPPPQAPPPPRRSGRHALLGAVSLLSLGAAGLAGVAVWPREPLPMAAVERARAALRRARVESAGSRPTRELARAVAAAARLERRLAEEQSARFRPQRTRQVLRLAGAAERAAAAAVLRSRRDRARAGEALAARRAAAEERAAALEREIEPMAADRGLRARFQRARVELDLAAAAADRGDLAAADAGFAATAAELDELDLLLHDRYERLRDPRWRRRWQAWVDGAVAATLDGGAAVVVDKSARRCFLVRGGRVAGAYRAELGRNGLARKLWAGDAATPEGRYRIVEKRDLGSTRFHRALLLDYPSEEDRRDFDAARRGGRVPRGRGIGGLIEIHGGGGSGVDWTSGCVALPNAEIDRLFAEVEVGTPVAIVGAARVPAPRGARR